MSSVIILNKNNVVSNGLNNTLRFDFTNSSVNFTNQEVALSSIQLYNSQFNIDPAYNNSTFSVYVPTNSYITLPITLPAGYYSYSDISNYISNQLIAIGAYLIDNAGNCGTIFHSRETSRMLSVVSKPFFSRRDSEDGKTKL